MLLKPAGFMRSDTGGGGGGLTPLYHDSGFLNSAVTSHTITSLDLSGHTDGDPIYIMIGAMNNSPGPNITSVTLDAVSATSVGGRGTTENLNPRVFVYKIASPTIGDTVSLVVNSDGGGFFAVGASIYSVPGASSEVLSTNGTVSGPSTIDLSTDVTAGDAILAAAQAINGGTISFTNIAAADYAQDIRSAETFGTAKVAVSTTENPRTMSAESATAPDDMAAVAVIIS